MRATIFSRTISVTIFPNLINENSPTRQDHQIAEHRSFQFHFSTISEDKLVESIREIKSD